MKKKLPKYLLLISFHLFYLNNYSQTVVNTVYEDSYIFSDNNQVTKWGDVLLIGPGNTGRTISAIFPFLLPPNNNNTITTASFKSELILNNNGVPADASVDLYGIDARVSGIVQGTDGYFGTYNGDASATAIQDGYLVKTSIIGDITTNATGEMNLTAFIQAQYDAGNAGKYVFLRLSPSYHWTNNQRFNIYGHHHSSHNPDLSRVAKLTITFNTTPKIWDGSQWTPVGAPTNTDDVIIQGNYSTVNEGNLVAKNCTVENNAILTINTGGSVVLDGDLTNNTGSEIIVQNQGSFIQTNGDMTSVSGNGTFTTKIETASLKDPLYTYFSSPSQTATIGSFSSWAQMNRVFGFNGGIQDWALANTTDVMVAGNGYIARPAGTASFTATNFNTDFIGKFNNGDITHALTFNTGGTDDDNELVGNPYPSGVNTSSLLNNNTQADAFHFWSNNTGTTTGSSWATGEYLVTNKTGSTNDGPAIIASGQGFFVVANASGNLKFTNAMRVTANNTFMRTPPQELKRVWLNTVSNTNTGSQILIAFEPVFGTDGKDAQYDAERLNNAANVSFYSSGIGVGTEKLAIQTRSDLSNDVTIPVGIATNDSAINSLTISIDHFENLDSTDIYLVDNELNITHNLKMSDYTFTLTQTGTIDNRFEILFSRNTLITNDELLTSENLIVSNNQSNIDIKLVGDETISTVDVFDVLGKKLLSAIVNSKQISLQNSINDGTILFVKVSLHNGQIISKKIIK